MTKTFAIPDQHGRFDLLELALEEIEQRAPEGGTVVFLGDYIDRGPASRQIIERLMAGPSDGWKWVCLKGNHEQMMVECLHGPELSWWVANGGGATIASYGGEVPEDHLQWCDGLPLLHDDGKRIFVHAAVDPNVSAADQREDTLLWMRYPERADITFPGRFIVHGHTPNQQGPEVYPARINLDTCAVGTGRLVVGVFDDEQEGGPVDLIEVRLAA